MFFTKLGRPFTTPNLHTRTVLDDFIWKYPNDYSPKLVHGTTNKRAVLEVVGNVQGYSTTTSKKFFVMPGDRLSESKASCTLVEPIHDHYQQFWDSSMRNLNQLILGLHRRPVTSHTVKPDSISIDHRLY